MIECGADRSWCRVRHSWALCRVRADVRGRECCIRGCECGIRGYEQPGTGCRAPSSGRRTPGKTGLVWRTRNRSFLAMDATLPCAQDFACGLLARRATAARPGPRGSDARKTAQNRKARGWRALRTLFYSLLRVAVGKRRSKENRRVGRYEGHKNSRERGAWSWEPGAGSWGRGGLERWSGQLDSMSAGGFRCGFLVLAV